MPHIKLIINGITREDSERSEGYINNILDAARMDKEEGRTVQAFIDGNEVEV